MRSESGKYPTQVIVETDVVRVREQLEGAGFVQGDRGWVDPMGWEIVETVDESGETRVRFPVTIAGAVLDALSGYLDDDSYDVFLEL